MKRCSVLHIKTIIARAVISAALLTTFLVSQGWVQPPVPSVTTPQKLPFLGILHLPEVEDAVCRLSNDVRRNHGFSFLEKDGALRTIARAHCDDMLRRKFFSHVNPDGLSPKDRVIPSFPRPIYRLGENIWKSFNQPLTDPELLARLIVDTWMKSPGHRDNILRPDFTHLNVGVAVRNREIFATQLFMKLKRD